MDKDPGIPEKNNRKIIPAFEEDRPQQKHIHTRPFFLTLLCLVAFVFYGLLSGFFLSALFLSGWISEVRSKYLPESAESKSTIIIITVLGLILHLISLFGSINMWYRRKSGYLMLSVSTMIIALFQLFSDRISIFTTAVYILFIILFGIYYKRFH